MKKIVGIGIGIAIIVIAIIGAITYYEKSMPESQTSESVQPPPAGKHYEVTVSDSVGVEDASP